MKIEKTNINNLISPEWNPRQITDEELQKLETSLNEFGYIEPIIVNDVNNHIVGGNQRAKALKTLGYTEVDVVYVHLEDINKEKACNVALNKISGEWDNDKLRIVLEDIELSDIDVSLTGFDEIELKEFNVTEPQEVIDDNYETEEDIEVNVEYGDIYKLGNHRLMCGDSTKEEYVNTLMNNQKARILFTSPPYSDMRDYHNTKESIEVNNIIKFISAFKPYTDYQIINLGLQQKDHEVNCYWNEYIEYARENDYKLLSWNVWDKLMTGSIGQQKRMFPLRHEWIFVFGTEPYNLNKTILKKQENINKTETIKRRRQKDGTMKISSVGDTSNPYKPLESIITLHPELGDIRKSHPATFPVQLPSEYIKAMTNEGDIVIDCFGGSGTTLIACEQLNREARLMEFAPEYCQVIINRWEEFTGEKAIKLN